MIRNEPCCRRAVRQGACTSQMLGVGSPGAVFPWGRLRPVEALHGPVLIPVEASVTFLALGPCARLSVHSKYANSPGALLCPLPSATCRSRRMCYGMKSRGLLVIDGQQPASGRVFSKGFEQWSEELLIFAPALHGGVVNGLPYLGNACGPDKALGLVEGKTGIVPFQAAILH